MSLHFTSRGLGVAVRFPVGPGYEIPGSFEDFSFEIVEKCQKVFECSTVCCCCFLYDFVNLPKYKAVEKKWISQKC